MKHEKEELITDFALYCVKYKDFTMEACIQTFYNALDDAEKIFFQEHWELCIGSAEALLDAKPNVQKEIIELSQNY